MKVIQLDKQIKGKGEMKGFVLKQIDKSQNAYIYESVAGKTKSYEVFKRKTSRVCLDFKNRIYSDEKVKEIYPKSKHFGVWAFQSTSLERAKEIFVKMTVKV